MAPVSSGVFVRGCLREGWGFADKVRSYTEMSAFSCGRAVREQARSYLKILPGHALSLKGEGVARAG